MKQTFTFIVLLSIASFAFAQGERDPHFDPVPIPVYTLPDPLTANDGTKITSAEQWTKIRRPEIYKMFSEGVYGVQPPKFPGMTFTVENVKTDCFNGKATRKEVVINYTGKPGDKTTRMLIYVPNNRPDGKKAPAFMGLNFRGNHTVCDDPEITITEAWVANYLNVKKDSHKSSDCPRGKAICAWPIEKLIDRGYALVTIHCGDIAPDDKEAYLDGIAKLFPKKEKKDGTEWKAISMWAWGLSCGLDYLQTDPDIDGTKVAAIGHSRLGKTVLWAGASDPRFALVISNSSGCGGASLYRRPVGECMSFMKQNFPHWFCDNLFQYVDREMELPFDMHELIALQAPRPVYFASSSEDIWADPKGEFLSACGAEPVYKLFYDKPLGDDIQASKMPALDTPVGGIIHYHVMTGPHSLTEWDWEQYMNMADKYVK